MQAALVGHPAQCASRLVAIAPSGGETFVVSLLDL